VFTGVSGITPLSPCLSWAHSADKLAFAFYEEGEYNVYALENPRSLRRQPYVDPVKPPTLSLLAVAPRDSVAVLAPVATIAMNTAHDSAGNVEAALSPDQPHQTTSIYRSSGGLRSSAETPAATDSGTPTDLSIRTLLDSASLALPDTAEFTIHPYHTRFSTDFVARPTVGYARDNFGRGFFGGASISLSDMLGDRTLNLGGAINGRLNEAQVFAVYANSGRRMNWAMGFTQDPYYFYEPTTLGAVPSPGQPNNQAVLLTTRVRRLVVRDLFTTGFYPLSRFSRAEISMHLVNVDDALLMQNTYYDPSGRYLGVNNLQTTNSPSIGYVSPSFALVHDNTLFSSVGPFSGSRSRIQIAPAFGGWHFVSGLADLRRYVFVRPFTLAIRGLYYGRFGRDGGQFPIYLGNPDFLRGYTSNSLIDHECVAQVSNFGALQGAIGSGNTGCRALDQLIGSRLAVANFEFRFPLTRALSLGFLPIGFPPIEGAVFYDAGLAWQNGSTLQWDRRHCGAAPDCRYLLRSWGGAIRANMFGFVILRLDYTKPLDRVYNHPYWTLSIGPTF
jgi:hypothetical protein